MFVGLAEEPVRLDAGKPAKWQLDETPSVNGISLGSTLSDVQGRLKTPKKRTAPPRDDLLGMGDLLELEFDGLIVELCRPPGDDELHVWRIQLTGQQWNLTPGLHIGMTRDAVVKVLGEPDSVTARSDVETLHYTFYQFDGWLWVEIAEGKLAKVALSEDWS